MTDITILKQWLLAAQEARAKLVSGTAVVEVWRDGRRMKFNEANLGDLNAYISDLERQIEEIEGGAAGRPARRRYIGISFG